MASSFERIEQAAHQYQPSAQGREMTKDELWGYLCCLTTPHVSITISSCWKDNILQQTGVKYPAAQEEAGKAKELQ